MLLVDRQLLTPQLGHGRRRREQLLLLLLSQAVGPLGGEAAAGGAVGGQNLGSRRNEIANESGWLD